MLLKVTTCSFRKLKLSASVGLRPQLSALKGVESEILLRQGYAPLNSLNRSELRSKYIEKKTIEGINIQGSRFGMMCEWYRVCLDDIS